MTVLVVGASGATGRLVVERLLERGLSVQIIVRSEHALPERVLTHKRLSVVHGTVLDLGDTELAEAVRECQAVVSCLGHNMSLKGMYGHPRWLVRDTARRLCEIIERGNPEQAVKYILMNTAGNSNRDIAEPVSLGHRLVVGLIRLLLPPYRDNEGASDYFRSVIGQDHGKIEWVALRPDTLIDGEEVTAYEVYPSPIRSAIFNPGTSSRINVAHFMARLVEEATTWKEWKGQMPVLYNR